MDMMSRLRLRGNPSISTRSLENIEIKGDVKCRSHVEMVERLAWAAQPESRDRIRTS